jgi:hypothetical protein
MKAMVNKFRVYTLFYIITIVIYNPISIFCAGQHNIGSKEVRIKAAYIYNFTKFVYWGTQSCDAATNPIIISVLGADPVFDLLEEYAKNQTQNHAIKVQKITKDMIDFKGCQLIFISHSEPQHVSAILKQLQGTKILTISDISGFTRSGGMIGFIIENDRVKLEINLNSVKKAGLTISAKLLEIARIVSSGE